MDKKTEQSRSRYNELAREYEDSFDGKFTLPYNQYLCGQLSLADGDSVLDVACGNGRLLRMLSKKAQIHAYGIDVSEEMITSAQSCQSDAVFRVSPADQMSFEDGSFDYVTVCCAFHHFMKPDAFMKEAHRVLKREGELVIAELSPAAVIRWIDNLFIPHMRMGDVRIYRIDELYAFFQKAGFININYEKSSSMIVIKGTKE
jgi:ubiquinone/menaquinone biosynthesis C-methylase UbiE